MCKRGEKKDYNTKVNEYEEGGYIFSCYLIACIQLQYLSVRKMNCVTNTNFMVYK